MIQTNSVRFETRTSHGFVLGSGQYTDLVERRFALKYPSSFLEVVNMGQGTYHKADLTRFD